MKPSPCVFDESGRVIGMVARLADRCYKGRVLRPYGRRKTAHFATRTQAVEWVLAESREEAEQ